VLSNRRYTSCLYMYLNQALRRLGVDHRVEHTEHASVKRSRTCRRCTGARGHRPGHTRHNSPRRKPPRRTARRSTQPAERAPLPARAAVARAGEHVGAPAAAALEHAPAGYGYPRRHARPVFLIVAAAAVARNRLADIPRLLAPPPA